MPSTNETLSIALLQIGLQGYGSMPDALAPLGPAERATYCNDTWAKTMPRMSTLEFTRDRKMMSTLTAGRRGAVLYLKVRHLPQQDRSLAPHHRRTWCLVGFAASCALPVPGSLRNRPPNPSMHHV